MTAAALKPVPLPPAEFDREYKGQLVVTKFNDYSLIRMICKDTPNAIACSYRTYKVATGAPISCLIMLGPKAHDDERALRHEIGHCNGWWTSMRGHGRATNRGDLTAGTMRGPTRPTRRGRSSGSGSARLGLSQKGDLPSSATRAKTQ